MKRVIYLMIMVNILIGLPGLVACRSTESKDAAITTAVAGMKDYLLANYDTALSLVRESPNANPNVYWLYSDNYLASLALEKAAPDIASAIVQAIDGYQFRPSERWKVLSGEAVGEDLFALGAIPVVITTQNDKEIRIEILSPIFHMKDWQQYADRLLLAALNASNRGDTKEAHGLFEKAQDMFDGLGFKDKAFRERGYYDTYKQTLYLIVAERLGIDMPQKREIVSLLLSLQENDTASNRYGGVYTEYDGNGKPFSHSDTNIETTSLALLAINNLQ